mmetsp:Transcript_23387/g.49646  ORF Transcript_23387/g.49646 Transcript_23387/m.49646 type:complete len:224 (-) Transcript_23387:1339-2010(-)
MAKREGRLDARRVVVPVADEQPLVVHAHIVDARPLGGIEVHLVLLGGEGERQLRRRVGAAEENIGKCVAVLLPRHEGGGERLHLLPPRREHRPRHGDADSSLARARGDGADEGVGVAVEGERCAVGALRREGGGEDKRHVRRRREGRRRRRVGAVGEVDALGAVGRALGRRRRRVRVAAARDGVRVGRPAVVRRLHPAGLGRRGEGEVKARRDGGGGGVARGA